MEQKELFPVSWQETWAGEPLGEPLGAVYTKPEVVQAMLDMIGYTSEKSLLDYRVLEPGCGAGAFVHEIVTRLIQHVEEEVSVSEEARGMENPIRDGVWDDPRWVDVLRAVDLNPEAVRQTRETIYSLLAGVGCPTDRADQLVEAWVRQEDFLLGEMREETFHFVVGNPPYVKSADLPSKARSEYIRKYKTMTEGTDLYIPFFEAGLRALSAAGTLAFISANRFVKNNYGDPLRYLIANDYRVRVFWNLEHTQPFVEDVSAYPAVFILDRREGPTLAGETSDLESKTLERAVHEALGEIPERETFEIFNEWYRSGEPWLTTDPEELKFLRALDKLPVLEESGRETKVGIGVATGADDIYIISKKDSHKFEKDRLLPLALAGDIFNDEIKWGENYLLNPFARSGELVDLEQYPLMKAYLETHEKKLKKRYVARKAAAAAWFRTIDRVDVSLKKKEKLLIPDIKERASIGYDSGELYPHHNCYYIVSSEWDLRALKALLRSSRVHKQVLAHSVSLRGGTPRFQAQTLRKIKIPSAVDFSSEDTRRLREVAGKTQGEVDRVVEDIWKLD